MHEPHNLPVEQATVEDLERIFLWTEPLQTARVFGAGLYALICIRHLMNGKLKVRSSHVSSFAPMLQQVFRFS